MPGISDGQALLDHAYAAAEGPTRLEARMCCYSLTC